MVIAPNDYPDFLKWMPEEPKILKYDTQKEEATCLLTKQILFLL